MKICILIPAFNEAKAIGELVASVRKKNLDVVVVDDGSSDGTGEIARKQGAHVIRHDPNKGKGISLQDGFEYVLSHKYDGVIAMDGDAQHGVDDLDTFIATARQFPDSVITGNRMSNTKDMPWLRLMTNRFMSWLISLVCKQSIPDTQCGYRYIGAKVLASMHLTVKDYEIESEVLIQASKKGFKVISVPIRTIYEGQVSKINPIRDTVRFFIYLSKELMR